MKCTRSFGTTALALPVVDEYQMIGDQDCGLNYEPALALAPLQTQPLTFSGSVVNLLDIEKWFQRPGRKAEMIRHDLRPVPLEDVQADNLNWHLPCESGHYWPRLIAKSNGYLGG